LDIRFPKKKDKSIQPSNSSGDFEDTLCDYVRSLGLPEFIKLKGYDFSSASVILIPSVPGYHKGADRLKYGHMKVRSVLEKEKMHEKFKTSPIACQFSSLGSLTENWLMGELADSFRACGGFYENSQEKSTEKGPSEHKSDNKEKEKKGKKRKWESNTMQIIWPTVDFVRNSIDGWSRGSLCFPGKNLKPFFHDLGLFHSYTSLCGREKVPPHIKTYTRYVNDSEVAWFFLTSANLSKAAMGELQKDNSQLMIRHYELGVLFVPSMYSKNTTFVIGENWTKNKPSNNNNNNNNSNNNTNTIGMPVPYLLPPAQYKGNDIPWMWDVPHPEPDIYGRGWMS